MAFSGKAEADQISYSAYVNLGTVLASVAVCNKTHSPKPDNPVD